jgi:hypothetical protein
MLMWRNAAKPKLGPIEFRNGAKSGELAVNSQRGVKHSETISTG